ncbi:MAG: nitroreductase family protein [Clostridia bacterium]
MSEFLKAIANRRSIYALGNEEIVDRERIETIVTEVVRHTPSPYNSQSTRVVLLFGKESKRLWQITLDTLKARISAAQYPKTEEKINNSFASGYGTILFFEEQAVVEGFQKQFPSYADNFAVWSEHTNAMHQFAIWTALEAEGLGASLQHYNPIIDDAVKKEWDLPASWTLRAQIPFGKPLMTPGEKEFADISMRVKVFGK